LDRPDVEILSLDLQAEQGIIVSLGHTLNTALFQQCGREMMKSPSRKDMAILPTYWEQITNFFVQRLTSGFVEGLNNLKRLIQHLALDLYGCSSLASPCLAFPQNIPLNQAHNGNFQEEKGLFSTASSG